MTEADDTPNATPDEISTLVAESAIVRVLNRYARGVDRRDWDLVRSCYHLDATDDRGAGPNRYRGGVNGLIAWLEKSLEGWASMHMLSSRTVDVRGSEARTEIYCLAWHQRTSDPYLQRVVPVRYVDSLERREGEWRIATRTCVYEPGWETEVSQPIPPLGAAGRWDRSDPSYTGFRHRSDPLGR